MRKTETSARSGAPSLKALRSFEAAARLESLTRAADELGVTVSAVAFQVRQVEEALGLKLFRREGRAIRVFPQGTQLAAALRGGFGAIDEAVGRLRGPPSPAAVVTVSMLPNFAALWLLPRMPALRAACPDVDLRIATTERLVDLETEEVDCAIRCGPGSWASTEAIPLFPQRLAPLCHWSWRQGGGRPTDPAALADEAIIANSLQPREWRNWFKAAGLDRDAPARAQSLVGRELVHEAVTAGLGAGLLDASVLEREIQAGDLVQLFPVLLETGWSHYLVTPAGATPSPACLAFIEWVKDEALLGRR